MTQKYISLNDHVCDFISEQIFTGDMLPGERINENLLCEKLKVSRTPIREALIQLSSKGLIEKMPRKGFYTKKMSIDNAAEIYEVIGIMEAQAAGHAMDKMNESTINKMSQIYEQLCIAIKYQDLRLYKDLQKEFHETFVKLCANQTLISLLDQLKFSISLQTYYTSDKELMFQAFQHYNEEHKLIIDYFKEKKRDELTTLLKEKHWQIIYTDIISST